MSKDHTLLFHRDPLAFMKKYACLPVGEIDKEFGDMDPTLFVSPNAKQYKMRSMGNAKKVVYLNFKKIGKNYNATQTSHLDHMSSSGQVIVEGSYTYDPTAGGLEAYWLPWNTESIIRLDIPSVPPLHGPDPDVFFTAGINGCSIFIQGTPQAPIVFHAGGLTDTQRPQEGADFWRTMMGTHAQTNGAIQGEVNKLDYVTDAGTWVNTYHPKTGKQLGQVYKLLGTHNSRHFEKWLKESTEGEFKIEEVSPEGCVFGLRDKTTRDWSFYLQENVVIKYTSLKKKGFFNKKIVESAVKRVYRPLQVTKFFPQGPANVRFAPALSRVLAKERSF